MTEPSMVCLPQGLLELSSLGVELLLEEERLRPVTAVSCVGTRGAVVVVSFGVGTSGLPPTSVKTLMNFGLPISRSAKL